MISSVLFLGELDNGLAENSTKETGEGQSTEKNTGAESKAEKLDTLIKRMGYKKMSLEIYNKMRDTFGREECEFCGRLFYSKADYEPHIRTHTG